MWCVMAMVLPEASALRIPPPTSISPYSQLLGSPLTCLTRKPARSGDVNANVSAVVTKSSTSTLILAPFALLAPLSKDAMTQSRTPLHGRPLNRVERRCAGTRSQNSHATRNTKNTPADRLPNLDLSCSISIFTVMVLGLP